MAVLSAVPLGASYYGNPENAVHQLLFNLTQEAGVSPDAIFHSDNNAFLNIKVHAIDSTLVVYIINSENRSASGRVEITVSGKKIQRIKDIISEQDIPFEQKEEKLSIPLEVRENQVMVLLLHP